MADGKSTLQLQIDLSNVDGTLTVQKPEIGALEGDALGADGAIRLQNGRATLTYRPPDYLTEAQLTEEKPVRGPWGELNLKGSASAWAAVARLDLTLTDKQGVARPIPVEIRVYRPPVMLLHGFIGDATTWQNLAADLAAHKFQAKRGEFYAGDESIEAQGRKLKSYLQEIKDDYAMADIKITRLAWWGTAWAVINRDIRAPATATTCANWSWWYAQPASARWRFGSVFSLMAAQDRRRGTERCQRVDDQLAAADGRHRVEVSTAISAEPASWAMAWSVRPPPGSMAPSSSFWRVSTALRPGPLVSLPIQGRLASADG